MKFYAQDDIFIVSLLLDILFILLAISNSVFFILTVIGASLASQVNTSVNTSLPINDILLQDIPFFVISSSGKTVKKYSTSATVIGASLISPVMGSLFSSLYH